MTDIDHTTADGVVVQHGETVWDEYRQMREVQLFGDPGGSYLWVASKNREGIPIGLTYSTEKAALLACYERLERQIIETTTEQVAVSRRLIELDEEES